VNSIVISTQNDQFRIGNNLNVTISEDMKEKAVTLNGVGAWSDIYTADLMNSGGKTNVISYYRAINNLNMLNNNLAVEMLTINESSISSLYGNLNTYRGGKIFLLETNSSVISSTDKNMLGVRYSDPILTENLTASNEGFFEDHTGNANDVILYYTIPEARWTLVQVIPRVDLLPLVNTVNMIIFIAIFFCLLFGLLFSLIQDVVVLKPLKNLLKGLENLHDDDFDLVLTTKSNDEIGKIVNRLKELNNEVYVSKIKQREAELLALEAQINPHFLYNTLDSIRWLALKDKNYGVSEQLEALSEMFRHVLHSGEEIVTIEEEMAFINDYMFLQQAKYGKRIRLELQIDPVVHNCLIPKLVLQPLVENAVLHGLEPKLEGGVIQVIIRRDGENISLSVSDNGVGVDGEKIRMMIDNKKQVSHAFALKNIDERIKLKYGESYGLNFSGGQGQGLRVDILIPYSKGGQA